MDPPTVKQIIQAIDMQMEIDTPSIKIPTSKDGATCPNRGMTRHPRRPAPRRPPGQQRGVDRGRVMRHLCSKNFQGIPRQIAISSSGIQSRQEECNCVMGLSPSGTVGAPVDVDPPSSVPPLSTPPSRSPPLPTPSLPTPCSLTPPFPSLQRVASHFGARVSRSAVGRQCGGADAGSSRVGPDRSAQGLRSTP